MGKDLERRDPQLPDRPELPSDFHDAVLACVKLLAATLPPGVSILLSGRDEGIQYVTDERAVALPGRLEFDVEVSGSQARRADDDPWWFMHDLTVNARVIWNGEEPELHVVAYNHMRSYPI